MIASTVFFFFKQKTAYEMLRSLVGSEMCIRDSLCATSVSSVSPWCGFTRNSSTTETQRTQRLHREERDRDFFCKAASRLMNQIANDLRLNDRGVDHHTGPAGWPYCRQNTGDELRRAFARRNKSGEIIMT